MIIKFGCKLEPSIYIRIKGIGKGLKTSTEIFLKQPNRCPKSVFITFCYKIFQPFLSKYKNMSYWKMIKFAFHQI